MMTGMLQISKKNYNRLNYMRKHSQPNSNSIKLINKPKHKI
jgi:hypothetical protein